MNLKELYDKKLQNQNQLSLVQYRSASLSINPASRAGACTDCEYIECTIEMIIIVILVRSLFFSLLTMLVLIRLTKRTHYIH